MWYKDNEAPKICHCPIFISSGREIDLSKEIEKLRFMREVKFEMEQHFHELLGNFNE